MKSSASTEQWHKSCINLGGGEGGVFTSLQVEHKVILEAAHRYFVWAIFLFMGCFWWLDI